MEEVARLANRLIVMREGRIVFDGTPLDAFLNHQSELRAAGVDVPHVTALLAKLKKHGLAVDETALTVEAAVKTIAAAVRRSSHAN